MNGIKKHELARDTRSWEGSKLPSYPQEQPQIVVMKIIIAPGQRLPLHYHPVINAGYVEKGSLTVIDIVGNERVFHAGEAIIEMVDKRHYGENRGESDVELIMFYASTPGLPLSENAD